MTLRAIEALASVSRDGALTARVPADVAPGEHRIIVVVEDRLAEPVTDAVQNGDFTHESRLAPGPDGELGPFGIRMYDVGRSPKGLSLRREDLYGDEGR